MFKTKLKAYFKKTRENRAFGRGGKIYSIKRFNINFKLIDESYNANPLSMKNAIQNFQK